MRMMKIKTLVTALTLAGLSCAMMNTASAADSVDLKVTGTISMGSCTPTFDNSAVDFGKISAASLQADHTTSLGTKQVSLKIHCEAARSVGFTITDNAPGVPDYPVGGMTLDTEFGLGKTAAGEPLGGFNIKLSSVTMDGTAGDVLSSADTGKTFAAFTGAADNAGTTVWSAGAAGTDSAAAPATDFVYGMDVTAALAQSGDLTLTDGATLAGSATFTLTYL